MRATRRTIAGGLAAAPRESGSHESSWLEATVRYLVEPRDTTMVKARITREVLTALGNASERVLLPSGAER